MTLPDPIAQVRRINRTWFVRGELAAHTAAYLDELENRDPEALRAVCERALERAHRASREHRDPKPDFYATLFSRATEADQVRFLEDHAWTRRRIRELAENE